LWWKPPNPRRGNDYAITNNGIIMVVARKTFTMEDYMLFCERVEGIFEFADGIFFPCRMSNLWKIA
jgi:hypothetical protein